MTSYMNLNATTFPLWQNGIVVLITIFIIGLGAHWVVEATARVAKRFGISELIIGLTFWKKRVK